MQPRPVPTWASLTLKLAGVYNLAFGAIVALLPNMAFVLAKIDLPRYPEIWQCVGMIVGVYGIGYWIAARDPARHWPIVLVGLLGKLLGPIGFLISENLPWSFGLILLFNDLVWWPFFFCLLYYAFQVNCDSRGKSRPLEFAGVLRSFRSNRGATLEDLSTAKPLLLVFLRHMGCTFCREAMSDLGRKLKEIEAEGVELAVVHMSPPLVAAQAFDKYGLYEIHRFSDPQCLIYEAFQLQRGTPLQLFGPKVWWRGIFAGLVGGHGIGPLAGDGFRMPGVFILHKGKITFAHRAGSAADRPNYVEFAKCSPETCPDYVIETRERSAVV